MRFKLRISQSEYHRLQDVAARYRLAISEVCNRAFRWKHRVETGGRTFEPATETTTNGQVITVIGPSWMFQGSGPVNRAALMNYLDEHDTGITVPQPPELPPNIIIEV